MSETEKFHGLATTLERRKTDREEKIAMQEKKDLEEKQALEGKKALEEMVEKDSISDFMGAKDNKGNFHDFLQKKKAARAKAAVDLRAFLEKFAAAQRSTILNASKKESDASGSDISTWVLTNRGAKK
jgi:hypothetical protein